MASRKRNIGQEILDGIRECARNTPRILGGEGGIRTPEPLRANGFQDRRIQPLCHLSAAGKV